MLDRCIYFYVNKSFNLFGEIFGIININLLGGICDYYMFDCPFLNR